MTVAAREIVLSGDCICLCNNFLLCLHHELLTYCSKCNGCESVNRKLSVACRCIGVFLMISFVYFINFLGGGGEEANATEEWANEPLHVFFGVEPVKRNNLFFLQLFSHWTCKPEIAPNVTGQRTIKRVNYADITGPFPRSSTYQLPTVIIKPLLKSASCVNTFHIRILFHWRMRLGKRVTSYFVTNDFKLLILSLWAVVLYNY